MCICWYNNKHKILLSKLNAYGTGGETKLWFKYVMKVYQESFRKKYFWSKRN